MLLLTWEVNFNYIQYYFVVVIFLSNKNLKIVVVLQLSETAIEGRESILFPSSENNDGKISGYALVKEYLVYATEVIFILKFFLNKQKIYSI